MSKRNSESKKSVKQSKKEKPLKERTPSTTDPIMPYQMAGTPEFDALFERLTAALDRNTQALNRWSENQKPAGATIAGKPIETKSYIPETAQMELPAVKPFAPVAVAKVTKAEVLESMKAIHGKDPSLAEKVLAKFGVTRLTEIKESEYAQVIQDCQSILA